MKALNKLLEGVREVELLKGIEVGIGDHHIEISHLFYANVNLIFC